MMEAPVPRPRSARVERKGRFTITEISPSSPCAAESQSSPRFQDGTPPSRAFADALAADKIAALALQTAADPAATASVAAVVPVVLPAMLEPQQSAEHDVAAPAAAAVLLVSVDKAPSDTAASAAQSGAIAPSLLTVVAPAVVHDEPEPSPGTHDVSLDHAAVGAAAPVLLPPLPLVRAVSEDLTQHRQRSPMLRTQASLTIDVHRSAALDAVANGAASAPATPSPVPVRRDHKRAEDASHRPLDRRVKRKSRFTITDLSVEPARPHGDVNPLFAKNDAASPLYASELEPSVSTDSIDFAAPSAGVSQDFSVRSTSSQDYHLFQTQVHLSERHPVASAAGEMPQPRPPPPPSSTSSRSTARSRTTPQKQRARENRRMRLRSVSPIRLALQMSDLTQDDSDSHADEPHELTRGRSASVAVAAALRNGHKREAYRSSAFFPTAATSSTDFVTTSVPLSTPAQSRPANRYAGVSGSGAAAHRRLSTDESDGYNSSSRHHPSTSSTSRTKSITISASQFLQQQQTIAALIRQQQELKHVIGVLQEQQQQLMSVPVQLHELRLENAKDDGKDEMMRELYVQVDSLMRANDSLQVLLTQAEKEAQDRAQEAEFLTEQNDQLLARCHYFERKYIDERKVTFILEEEVQRFRMMSLTQELEQRTSVAHDDDSSFTHE